MGRKKKRGSSHLNSSASFSIQEGDSSQDSLSFRSVSLGEDTLPEALIVSSSESTGHDQYAEYLDSDWHDVVFLHPSILRACGIVDLVLIESEQKRMLYNAVSLGNMKKSLIIFPKNCIFNDQEIVKLQPYDAKVKNAKKIIIFCNGKENPSVMELIFKELCNRYIYVGLLFKCKLFDREYQCVIRDITYSPDIADLSLKDTSNFCEQNFYKMCRKTSLKLESQAVPFESGTSAFAHIGGLEEQINAINTYTEIYLNSKYKVWSEFCGVLMLHGPPGTGKSLVLDTISKSSNFFTEFIHWDRVCSMAQKEVEQEFETVFDKAIDRAPSIVIIDDFNLFCPKDKKEDIHHIFSKTLSRSLDKLDDAKVMIVAAVNDSEYDVSVLQTSKRKMDIIKFHIPSSSELVDILQKLLAKRGHIVDSKQIEECATIAYGFSGKDILDCIKNAEMLSSKRRYHDILDSNDFLKILKTGCYAVGSIKYNDLKQILKLKKPAIVEADVIKVKKVQWSDIGGMADVKEKLKQIVEWPLRFPELFKHFDIKPARGVLMFGPPGCSKTMIAKALATECGLNFISRNVSDLFNKYVGESEKAIRDMFVLAKTKAPCIIFLDEIDALGKERGSSSSDSGVGDRIVSTLLTHIDGIEEVHGVTIIAATNRPDVLDKALIRAARINKYIYVPLPDAETREEILKISMRNRLVSEDFDFKLLSAKTEGYSGAEIVNICNEAALQVIAENHNTNSSTFTIHHFEEALKYIPPRINKELIVCCERFYKNYC